MILDRRPIPPSNYFVGRETKTIATIVMHHMHGTAQGADARFKNPTASVSAHFGVLRSADVWRWVADEDTAYHAGNWETNLSSIGIEHEDNSTDDFTPAQLEASAQLLAKIAALHGLTLNSARVLRHRDIVATVCPGSLPVESIIARANEILGEDEMTPAQEAKLDRVLELLEAREALVWDTRLQRNLNVETGKPFNPNDPPIDPRIET